MKPEDDIGRTTIESSTPRKRVMIVADQRLIADLENTLTRIGYHVVASVVSGEEAPERASDICPDVILMDLRLDGEADGIAAAGAIRKRLDVPIVYLTADEDTILRAKGTSPFGYVVKPFNERELRAAVEVAIYKHETEHLLDEERARRRAAEEFKLLVDSVPDYAIFVLDAAGRVVTCNEGAQRITGFQSEEILRQHCSVFYQFDAIVAKRPQRDLELASRDGRYAEEGWRVRKDGTEYWADVTITALRDEAGALRGFGIVARDLSERKNAADEHERLIAELREAVHSRDEFLRIASHELRTPLTPLVLQLQVLDQTLTRAGLDAPGVKAKVASAMRQTRRLIRLVDDLLNVARITSGRLELDIEPVDLAELVREVAARFRDEAAKAGSDLTVRADDNVLGRWDRLRVEQIVTNLLGNAVKYGTGKPIEVETRVADGTVRISVSDRGIGIDEAALERIFARFERAVSASQFGGLGLGLFIARQLAEAHGGTIVAQSKPGLGSTFTVLLPVEASHEARAASHDHEPGV